MHVYKAKFKGLLTHYCVEALEANIGNVEDVKKVHIDFLSGDGFIYADTPIDQKKIEFIVRDIMGYKIFWLT